MPTTHPSLTADDVRRVVRDRCFAPSPPGRVGVELEWLVLDTERPDRAIPFAPVEAAVAAILPLPGGSRVTYEPGGQLELSTPPGAGIAAACALAEADTAAVRDALRPLGVDLVGMGLDPARGLRRVVDSPRYRAMESYFATDGPAGRRMMCGTAGVQVNLETGTGDAVATRWRLALGLGPVLAAAFAHSPFAAGRPTGLRSTRLAAWEAIDRSRTAPPASGTVDPVEAWTAYALAARVMLLRADADHYVALTMPLTFEQWMGGGHELGWPTVDDLEYHLTTLFPPVRPRGWLELRMVDAVPHPWWRVAVAVTAALLDDEAAAEGAALAAAPVAGAWADAVNGLASPELAAAARTCFALALDALPRLDADPATIALTTAYAERFVDRGRCPADDLLDAWAGDGSLLPAWATLEPTWT